MKSTIFCAYHLCGPTMYQINPSDFGGDVAPSLLDIDVDLPDAELFEVCLNSMAIRWSSRGQVAFFKSSMAKGGVVRRSSYGFVFVSGNGWCCGFAPKEALELENQLIKAKKFEEAAQLRMPFSTTEIHVGR